MWESTKEPMSQKWQRDDTNEPYLGIRGLLEFGGGYPPPDLRFRNLLKNAT